MLKNPIVGVPCLVWSGFKAKDQTSVLWSAMAFRRGFGFRAYLCRIIAFWAVFKLLGPLLSTISPTVGVLVEKFTF